MKDKPRKECLFLSRGERPTGAVAGTGHRAQTGQVRQKCRGHPCQGGFEPLLPLDSQEDTVHSEPAASLGRGTARVSNHSFLEPIWVPLWCR